MSLLLRQIKIKKRFEKKTITLPVQASVNTTLAFLVPQTFASVQ